MKAEKVAKADLRHAHQPEVTDIAIVDAIRDSGVKAAIISQHTLYPYHFDADGDMLNGLGERDLAVLSSHFRTHHGELNIPRGNLDAKLYEARVAHVHDALDAAGVSSDNVHIVDTLSGSMVATPSEDCLRDLRNSRALGSPQNQQGGGSTVIQAPSSSSGESSGGSNGGSNNSNGSM